jgi:SAM-dependent methyltransferase
VVIREEDGGRTRSWSRRARSADTEFTEGLRREIFNHRWHGWGGMVEGGRGAWRRVSANPTGKEGAALTRAWRGACASTLAYGHGHRGEGHYHSSERAGRGRAGRHVGWVFETVAKLAAQRYRPCGITAWQFARGKLLGDPVYRAVLDGPWLKRGGTVIDLGCGQGLMLALIAEGRVAEKARSLDMIAGLRGLPEGGGRPAAGASSEGKLMGVELRPKVAGIARRALGDGAEIIAADARSEALPVAGTILVFDVLHMMPAGDQEALLRGLVAALEPGGTLLLREADAGAGWRFQAVNFANRAKAFFFGYSSKGFCFRTKDEWRALLESYGLSVEVWPMGKGTPYGNVLLAGRAPEFKTARVSNAQR